MLDNYRVKTIYRKIEKYPNISLHAPLGHAFHIMHHMLEDKTKYRTLLVLDDDDHLKGYLSLRDLIRAIGPDYLKKKAPNFKGHQPFEGITQDFTELSLIWQEGFTLKLDDQLCKPVAEFMTLMEEQVSLEDTLAKSIYLMLVNDLLVLPVVEEEQVVGVIRLVDLFECMATHVEQAWLPDNQPPQ